MYESSLNARHLTTSAQQILGQVSSRAGDRGLHVVDGASFIMLALWSLLRWERKVGLVALERLGVDIDGLARGVDALLVTKAKENPVAVRGDGTRILAKTGKPYRHWDGTALREPLLQQAEHEALNLGHTWVGTEHLLLAIVALADPDLADLLTKHALAHARVKEAVVQLLRS